MARWKLLTPHYLNVAGVEWEYREVDRRTGRERRIQIPVPQYLDPKDPADWTTHWGNRDNPDGEIIVCHRGQGEPSDIVFLGDPTPDMMPMDDGARAISQSFAKHWSYKPELAATDYSQSLIDKFQIEMAEARSKAPEAPGLGELVQALTALVSEGAVQPIRRPA